MGAKAHHGMKMPTGFRLASVPLNLSKLPAVVQDIRKALDGLPRKVVVPTKDLAEMVGRGVFNIRHHSTHPALKPYRLNLSANQTIWGGRKTIETLQRELAKQQE